MKERRGRKRLPALAFLLALAVLLLVAGCKGRDGNISEKTDPTKRSAEQTEAQAEKTDTATTATAVENDAAVDFTGTSEGADQETRNAGGETKNTDGETGTPAETTGRPDVPETDFQQFAEGKKRRNRMRRKRWFAGAPESDA